MRIAVFLHGGVGGGHYSQGQPTLMTIIEKISEVHELTVYTVLPPNTDFVPNHYRVKTIHKLIKHVKVRYVLLAGLFLIDHLKTRFNLIHAFWGYPSGAIAVLLGKVCLIPSVVTLQGGEAAAIKSIPYGNMLNAATRRITLWTCRNATCLNSVSRFLLHELKKFGLDRHEVLVTPFGADKNLFSIVDRPRNAKLKILHVANLTAIKNQSMLLEAFRNINRQIPAELTIIGGDYSDGMIHRLADALELSASINFIPALPQSSLPSYYASSDFLLVTSWHEGLPTVAIEAMISGVVVCGTRVGLLDDLGTQYFGVSETHDASDLAGIVIDLWSDPNNYYLKQANALRWSMEHDMTWTVNQYLKNYESLILQE